MMYIEFYHNSTGYIDGIIPPQFSNAHIKPIPACGSDSVLILDGRYNMAHQRARGRYYAKLRGFIGFTINKGESFMRSKPITDYIEAA